MPPPQISLRDPNPPRRRRVSEFLGVVHAGRSARSGRLAGL